MRKTLYALLLVPALALGQNAKPAPGAPGPGPGPDAQRVQKRMQLARTLGLASALDLDTDQALKLGQTLSKFDDRRRDIREKARDARETLRNAAQGGKVTPAEVDGAIAKLLDLRAQSQALDREMLQAVTQNLSPQQKARAVMFLGSFRHGMDRHMMGRGPGGPGGPGMGPGHGGHGAMMDRGDHDHDHMAMRGGSCGGDDDASDGGGEDL